MVHRLNHQWLAPLDSGKCFFGRFLLRLGRIKRSQAMYMVKFSPIALNFGYDFVLLVHFLGTPCSCLVICFKKNGYYPLDSVLVGWVEVSTYNIALGCIVLWMYDIYRVLQLCFTKIGWCAGWLG